MGQYPKIRCLDSPFPPTGRNPVVISRRSQANQKTWSLQHVLGLPRDLHPVGHALNTNPMRCPGDFRTRCPCHLNNLLLLWRNSNSTLSSLWVTELLILSLSESPDTLQRELSRFYLGPCSFNHDTEFMTKDEYWNKDWPVNWELHFLNQFSLHEQLLALLPTLDWRCNNIVTWKDNRVAGKTGLTASTFETEEQQNQTDTTFVLEDSHTNNLRRTKE